MGRLGLSQSGASRHLDQLAATGYLTVEHRVGSKQYRLRTSQILCYLGRALVAVGQRLEAYGLPHSVPVDGSAGGCA